ncbi:hypothetical protein EJ110_NYTH53438 [Nymphaea thermarum]|nr:hypothetical protein EJ110_NYTH53438 [Nymphaea thermarum]
MAKYTSTSLLVPYVTFGVSGESDRVQTRTRTRGVKEPDARALLPRLSLFSPVYRLGAFGPVQGGRRRWCRQRRRRRGFWRRAAATAFTAAALGVMSSSPRNLDEAVTMARRMEEDWARTQRDHQKKTSQHTQGGRMPVKHHHPSGRAKPYERRDGRAFRQSRPGRSETTQGSVASPTSPRCPTCSHAHPGKPCYRMTGACLHCGGMGHFIKDCPLKKERDLKKPEAGPSSVRQTAGRVYATTVEELQAHDLVEGTLLVGFHIARVLFDAGATHSFISSRFATSLEVSARKMPYVLKVVSPMHAQESCSEYLPDVDVEIHQHHLPAQLVILNLSEFDVILGMDWLHAHYANIDCRKKQIQLLTNEKQPVEFLARKASRTDKIMVSAVKAKRWIENGSVVFLASAGRKAEVVQAAAATEGVPAASGGDGVHGGGAWCYVKQALHEIEMVLVRPLSGLLVSHCDMIR